MSGIGRAPGTRPLVLDRVDVGQEYIEAVVRVADGRLMRTRAVPGLADSLLLLLPGLSRHRCDSGSAHGIESEISDTETPHLLEHVVLELMALSGSPRDLRGETTWDFSANGPGVFWVRIGYDDDLVALGALQRGLAVVNALLLGEQPPDPSAFLGELRALRAQ